MANEPFERNCLDISGVATTALTLRPPENFNLAINGQIRQIAKFIISHDSFGLGLEKIPLSSIANAYLMRSRSRYHGAINCRPTGKLSLKDPTGMVIAGNPVKLANFPVASPSKAPCTVR